MFDLTLLPIHIRDGQEQAELPGLFAANAPKRAARGRPGDQLLILFSLSGNAPISADSQRQLLVKLSETYFQTPGSVTAALRGLAEMVNQILLDRNLRNTSTGRQGIGLINLVVVHGQTLTLAQSGPVLSILLSQNQAQIWNDPLSSGRGLGTSRTISLRFYQAEVQPGDRLLLATDAPATWRSENLQGSLALNTDLLRRRLLTPAPAQVLASLITFQTGSGLIRQVQFGPSGTPLFDLDTAGLAPVAAAPLEDRPTPVAPTTRTQAPANAGAASAPPPAPENKPAADPAPARAAPAAPFEQQPPWEMDEPAPAAPPAAQPQPERSARPAARLEDHAVSPHQAPASAAAARPEDRPAARPATPRADAPARQRPSAEPFLRGLQTALRGERQLREKSSHGFQTLLQRMLPGRSGEPSSLSPITMAFIAIAIPLVIVVAALMVYNERGRQQQYQAYFTLAVQAAVQTQDQSDPAILRKAWSETIEYLSQADSALPDQTEAVALRQQAQRELDLLDKVERLPFQPAIIGGLSSTVNVTQMLATTNELYLLNAAQGRVMRAVLTGDGYEMDPGFNCAPGPSGSLIISDLVDIALLPKANEFNASLLAIDSTGNIMFCTPGSAPTSYALIPPDSQWGKITAIVTDPNGLYVLDTINNAVWVFAGVEGYHEPPRLFFGNEVPPLLDAIDLAINGEDLVMLHADGRLTQCTATYVGEYNTRCTDPALLTDTRPGREQNPAVLPDAHFTQLQYTAPPDPSYYLLDTANAAIYHFSLRFNLQRQLRTLAPPFYIFPEQQASAMAISPNRIAFMAFGSQVFYTQMP